jgi:hypothetical protein
MLNRRQFLTRLAALGLVAALSEVPEPVRRIWALGGLPAHFTPIELPYIRWDHGDPRLPHGRFGLTLDSITITRGMDRLDRRRYAVTRCGLRRRGPPGGRQPHPRMPR